MLMQRSASQRRYQKRRSQYCVASFRLGKNQNQTAEDKKDATPQRASKNERHANISSLHDRGNQDAIFDPVAGAEDRYAKRFDGQGKSPLAPLSSIY
jgi:hypothetical protein